MGVVVSTQTLQAYPTLEAAMNLARSVVNDTTAGATNTPGEGNILTDNTTIAPFAQPFLNSAIREVYRELANVGDAELIVDNFIVSGLTPINGVNGLGNPDPGTQVTLTTQGYFDGTNWNSNLLLPSNCMYPTKLWERITGSNNPFMEMKQPQDGLVSCNQNTYLGTWEWRANQLFFTGSLSTEDIRMRYVAALPQFFSSSLDYTNTYVPLQDSIDAIAYKIALKYCTMMGSPLLAEIKLQAAEHMRQLKNSVTRRMQSINYERPAFQQGGGHDDGLGMG